MRTILLLDLSIILLSASFLTAAEPPVEGTLTLSTKPYDLKHIVAYSMKYLDEPATAILASPSPLNVEQIKQVLKEHNGKDEEISLREPHVKLVFDKKGKFKSFYAYAAGFTTNTHGGNITSEFKLEGNRAVGKAALPSSGEEKLQKAFDFKFAVELLNTAAEPIPGKTAETKPTTPVPSDPTTPTKPAKPEKPATPAAAALKAKELALPEGASAVEFKAIVKHIAFQHKSDVKTLAADITARLATQGFTADGADLITPASAILRRQRGAAKLTIMIKPSAAGSEVKMFTEGLDWEK